MTVSWLHSNRAAHKLTIAVDFDGTVVENSATFPDVGADAGAGPWLRHLNRHGVRLLLWTCRDDDRLGGGGLDQAWAYWRNVLGIEPFGVNHNPRYPDSRKVHAHVYVDDRSLGCPTRIGSNGRPVVDWAVVGPALCVIAGLYPLDCATKLNEKDPSP